MDMFSALLGKSLSGGGGSEPVLISKSISSNGTYNASDDNADGYRSVSVSVPNSYTQSDEGKVVSNGALVAQGSDTVTENGTVDTTLISSLLVNVSGGGSSAYKLSGIYDAYLTESNEFIYIYGIVEISSISSRSFSVTIPNDFDVSKIGTGYNGTISVNVSSFNGARLDASISGNTITFNFPYSSFPQGDSMHFIYIFNKA